MNGKDLLKGMSFVDESLVKEADEENLQKRSGISAFVP